MQLRLALPNDIPALFKIRTCVSENHLSLAALAERGITPESLSSGLEGDGRGWVIEWEGKVVAFCMANCAQQNIFALFVLPDYEGKGLGRLLINTAEKWLFEKGCEAIWLLTDKNPQVRANGFYLHLGWIDNGVQENGQVRFIKRAGNIISL